jgi:hypothetical protein
MRSDGEDELDRKGRGLSRLPPEVLLPRFPAQHNLRLYSPTSTSLHVKPTFVKYKVTGGKILHTWRGLSQKSPASSTPERMRWGRTINLCGDDFTRAYVCSTLNPWQLKASSRLCLVTYCVEKFVSGPGVEDSFHALQPRQIPRLRLCECCIKSILSAPCKSSCDEIASFTCSLIWSSCWSEVSDSAAVTLREASKSRALLDHAN